MDRLEILKNSKVISENTYDKAKKAEKFLLKELKQSECFEMMITHYSMALERMMKNEKIDSLSEEGIKEIENHKNYKHSIKLLEELNKITETKLSVEEEKYILLHLLNLIN